MYRETRYRHPSPSSECPNCGHHIGSGGTGSGGTGNAAGGASGGGQLTRTMSESVHHSSTYCGKRKYSMVKFGYHLAVPLARRTQGQQQQQQQQPEVAPSENAGNNGSGSSSSNTPHVIALVGLPARGKTYISKKLSRYLNWIGINTRVFNLGEYRRKMVPEYNNAEFFSAGNAEGNRLREQVCLDALEDVVRWLREEDGEVAVFDATNTTRQRRKLLYERLVQQEGFNLFFVESICDKEDIIDGNIKEVKVTSPDYVRCNEDEVVRDFKARIKHYADQYETLDDALEPEYSFLKIFNAGEKVLVHKHEGHIQSRIVYYLMNIHITHRTIYLSRHGESDFNTRGLIGGDSDLTNRGHRYARMLASYVERLPSQPKLKVWTSWMRRTIETTRHLEGVQERWKALNEIDAGSCDSLTYGEIKDRFPQDFVARDQNKFSYRYPRGESYEDLVARLEPVIMELERQDSVIVVSHQAVLRCLLSYYLETPEDEMPWMNVPLHTVIKLEPIAYGCKVHYIKFPVDCVSTYRKRPVIPGELDDRLARNVILEEKRRSLLSVVSETDLMASLEIGDHVESEDERKENFVIYTGDAADDEKK